MLKHLIFLLLLQPFISVAWGFYGHKKINHTAIFTLPPELFGFYKIHAEVIKNQAVNADSRRYMVKGEAPKHYIDLEYYKLGDSLILDLSWKKMVEQYGEDSLMASGILPWNLKATKRRLERAFKTKNIPAIIRYSADLGHYVADAHVPLHTTKNYDGQLTGQHGIHAFWESRLPELFTPTYDLFVGQATYIYNLDSVILNIILESHAALDSVLNFEKELTETLNSDLKYAYVRKKRGLQKTYSSDFSREYHRLLKGQVERRMRAAIKRIGDFWFTAWVNAGQPVLDRSADYVLPEFVFKRDSLINTRKHEIEE